MADLGTCPALVYMSKNQPELMQALTDEIVEDFEFHYTYAADAFPRRSELESSYQKEQRLVMIEEWMNTNDWQATKKQETHVLTPLFYSIWNQRYALQSSSKQTLLPSYFRSKAEAFTNRMPQGLIRPQSKDFEPEKHSTQFHAQHLKSLGKIDHRGILKHMLDKVMDLHAIRCGDFLNTRDNWETLLPCYLRSKLWEVCRKEEILLSENITSTSGHSRSCIWLFTTALSSLLSIGGDIDCPTPGIYMHIFWDPAEGPAGSSYLYVGQSGNIQERIRRHNDPWNRARHPSLRYHLWDSKPGMNSAFVILGITGNLPQLQLNLLESWCCLMFQTLPSRDLRTYLPEGTARLGCHLNVADPLWQSFTGCKQDQYERKERFRELVLDLRSYDS